MSYERHNPYGRVCANCSRPINGGVPYYYSGPEAFCSPMCRDTSDDLRKYEAHLKEFPKQKPGTVRCRLCDKAMPAGSVGPNYYCSKDCEVRFLGIDTASLEGERCGVDGCFVCSGAIRSRAGKGDQS